MKALRLTKEWRSPTGILRPGEYAIPKDITMRLARCARADKAGEIIAAGNFLSRINTPVDAAFSGKRKEPAPENKRGRNAPENKSEV